MWSLPLASRKVGHTCPTTALFLDPRIKWISICGVNLYQARIPMKGIQQDVERLRHERARDAKQSRTQGTQPLDTRFPRFFNVMNPVVGEVDGFELFYRDFLCDRYPQQSETRRNIVGAGMDACLE